MLELNVNTKSPAAITAAEIAEKVIIMLRFSFISICRQNSSGDRILPLPKFTYIKHSTQIK